MVFWFIYVHIDKYNTITLWISIIFLFLLIRDRTDGVSRASSSTMNSPVIWSISKFPDLLFYSEDNIWGFCWFLYVFGALDDILTNCWNIFNRLSAPISNQEDTAVFYPIKSVYWSWRVEVVRSAISKMYEDVLKLYQEPTTLRLRFH